MHGHTNIKFLTLFADCQERSDNAVSEFQFGNILKAGPTSLVRFKCSHTNKAPYSKFAVQKCIRTSYVNG